MSSPPRDQQERKPITLLKLAEKRALGEPIVMVTAYDHPSALIVVAAWIGDPRLIDNVKAATPERRGADPKGAVSVLPTP